LADAKARDAQDLADIGGILRPISMRKGNFGLGAATEAEALTAGTAWVGESYTVASDGKTMVSADGLRQFRPPSFKPRLDKWQANFEERFTPSGQWQRNGHLDIRGER
jgi:filamentous hemagglutinin